MAEVIGVVASIVGILAAAGKIAEVLDKVVPALTQLQPNTLALASETASTIVVLTAIEGLLSQYSASVPGKRKSLVSLDHLVLILTDGVLLLSQLQGLVDKLGEPTDNSKMRRRWARKEAELGLLYARLCSFKSSMMVMLNILQCDSDSEASRSMENLQGLVHKLLENNKDLARRL